MDWETLSLAAIGAVLLLRFRINSAWLVLGGAAVGIAIQLVRGG
jgi:chromate transporter